LKPRVILRIVMRILFELQRRQRGRSGRDRMVVAISAYHQ